MQDHLPYQQSYLLNINRIVLCHFSYKTAFFFKNGRYFASYHWYCSAAALPLFISQPRQLITGVLNAIAKIRNLHILKFFEHSFRCFNKWRLPLAITNVINWLGICRCTEKYFFAWFLILLHWEKIASPPSRFPNTVCSLYFFNFTKEF